jgi:hypothetical protein
MARFKLLRELRKKGEGDTIDVDDVMFADDGMIHVNVFHGAKSINIAATIQSCITSLSV